MRLLPLLLLLTTGCSISRAVAPLHRGEGMVTSSLGGPFVQYGSAPIPLPITSVGYAHGVTDQTSVHGALYLTNLVAFGVPGFDIGAAHEILPAAGARPRLMLDGTLYSFFGDTAAGDPPAAFRLFADISVIVSWDLGKAQHHVYLGVDNFFQPFPSFRYYPTPLIGAELKAGRQVGILAEVKYMAFWKDTLPLQPVWYGIDHHGAISVQLGVNVHFDTRRKKARDPKDPASGTDPMAPEPPAAPEPPSPPEAPDAPPEAP